MSQLRILVVDDEAPARVRMANLISDIQDQFPCEIVGEASDAQTALDLLIDKRPDVLLLDVQMPGMTGMELAQHILKNDVPLKPGIIFVTAYDDYAIAAFELHAIDYLLKPIKAARLEDALKRAQQMRQLDQLQAPQPALQESLKQIAKQRQNFSVLEKNRVLLIPVRDVLFLKAEQKYVTIQTRNRAYLTEESLVSIEADLSDIFVRAHRNALVARDAILGVERAAHLIDVDGDSEKSSDAWQVIVRDFAERLPISRRQWAVIKALVR